MYNGKQSTVEDSSEELARVTTVLLVSVRWYKTIILQYEEKPLTRLVNVGAAAVREVILAPEMTILDFGGNRPPSANPPSSPRRPEIARDKEGPGPGVGGS
jgi:hypothetical protein